MATSLKREFAEIDKYREGAQFRKMDLHTHSPASECSSYTLPDTIEKLLPQPSGKAWLKNVKTFLGSCSKGKIRLKQVLKQTKLSPRLTKKPKLDVSALRDIATDWLKDIESLDLTSESSLTADQRKARQKRLEEYLKLSLRDIRNYLASLFFPEDYVLRCTMEGIELVALTDHNHPGYIVPRLPKLGTWLSAVESVNQTYQKDIRRTSKPGDKVRQTIVKRLEHAGRVLNTGIVQTRKGDATTKKCHKDRKKKLSKLTERKDRVEALVEKWKNPQAIPRALTVLPGTEVTVSNVHVICIFPPEWYVPGRIASTLASIGIPEAQWGRGFEAAASASVQDTIEKVSEAGGIAIPAHSNSDFKGLLRLFKKGLALNKVIEHPALLALETIGGSVIAKNGKKAKDACETLRWLESGSSRPRRPKPICFTKGSDAHECRIEYDGTGEDLGMRFTYVKMDIRHNDTPQEVFRSLRLALSNGQNRIVEYPPEDGYNYNGTKTNYRIMKSDRIKTIEWGHRTTILGLTAHGQGSYAGGLQVRFNPYLNCVIGSGGKSTLVRTLGYAFGVQKFLSHSTAQWLPELVRAYWQDGGHIYCVERKGKNIDPNADAVRVRWHELQSNGSWHLLHESPAQELTAIHRMVDIWPPAGVQDEDADLKEFEDDVIKELADRISYGAGRRKIPLLVNQPRDIFDSKSLFSRVLSKPTVKYRQILWSTASPNVPTALDSEKIIITGEKRKGRQMKLICGGDLHEDEIREQFVDHFEGGWPGFNRRQDLYSI